MEAPQMAMEHSSTTPYKLDLSQTLKACKVLQTHIAQKREDLEAQSDKVDLLRHEDTGSDGEPEDDENDTPIWMVVSTKKHIADSKRLKPSKIRIPHPFNTSSKSSICLISSDPQRLYKDQIADPSFPATLRSRINRVIGLKKLKAKFKTFETRRQLLAEHDFFLADDRIVTYLPKVLGKVFYKGTGKRPIPVRIGGPPDRNSHGQKIKNVPGAVRKSTKDEVGSGAAKPTQIAHEIERALSAAIVHISESASTAVKVGRAAFTPEQCVQNIEAVVQVLTEKFIPQGWRNIRALHLKGPNTMSFPIWLATELWIDEKDVLDEKKTQGKKGKKALPSSKKQGLLHNAPPLDESSRSASASNTQKRKAHETTKPDAARHAKKKRKADAESIEGSEIAARKQLLKDQKDAVVAEVI